MRKNIKKMLTEMAQETMLRPVPNRGLLFHPADTKRKNQQGKQVTFNDILKKKNDLPENIQEWTTRNFVDYFAKQFQEHTGGNYRKIYKSDCAIVAEIMRVLDENQLDKHIHTKKLIDWGFLNKTKILKKSNYMSIQSLADSLNYYTQNFPVESDQKSSKADESLLREINESLQHQDALSLFEKHGIPIMITYYVNIKNLNEKQLLERTAIKLTELKQAPNGRKRLINIARSSINNSPYPEGFCGLDWRNEFKEIMKTFYLERWWKDEDTLGEVVSKYLPFLK